MNSQKLDTGAKDMAGHPGEKITDGLDGLRDRLDEYSHTGARFARWRAVIAVGDCLPCRGCIEANAQALARYASLSQEAGLVPVAVPGLAFLLGGQSGELASASLNAMHVRFKSQLPWALAFSFARAIQLSALEIWRASEANVLATRQALVHRARCSRAESRG
jgi:fructose-bisphosphate aldolase class 1